MNTEAAFAMALASFGKERMVFDWDTAAKLIAEHKPRYAAAGLRGDWEYTGGMIYKGGKVVEDYTFLSSTWAVPELEMDGERIPCFVMETQTDWDEHTKWPESAREILARGE